MISDLWISAPAGVSGTGSLAVRPGACGDAPAVVARLRDLPATRVPAPAYVGAPTGERGFGIDRLGFDVFDRVGAADSSKHQSQQNGTTLGIHSSGRPRS